MTCDSLADFKERCDRQIPFSISWQKKKLAEVWGCVIRVEFKGLRKSNQTYPGAAIFWVNSEENMHQQPSNNSEAENNQPSLKAVIRENCLW